MAGLDKNTIFLLKGDAYQDASSNEIKITSSMTASQIVDDNNNGVDIKAINFNSNAYIRFDMDGSFLQKAYTIDWWEYDNGDTTNTGTTSLFNNIITASNNFNFGFVSNNTIRNGLNAGSKANTSTYDIFSNFIIGNDKAKEWVHRAVVFDKKSYKFYENGKLYAESVTTKTPEVCNTFQMNRWRATSNTNGYGKKVYNFRISDCVRWIDEFTPQVEPYTEPAYPFDELENPATQTDVIKSLITITNKLAQANTTTNIKTYTQTTDAGGTETYYTMNMNGLKFMFIDYSFTDSEYNGATSGMFYKEFSVPEEAQIFTNIMYAGQISNARSGGENHLSRIMQNTEIASNSLIRVRYRHDELKQPFIGRVRVMVVGI